MARQSCSLISQHTQTSESMGDGTLMSLGPEDAGKVQKLILQVLELQQEVEALKKQRKEEAEARGELEQKTAKLRTDNAKLVGDNVSAKGKVAKAYEMLQRMQQQTVEANPSLSASQTAGQWSACSGAAGLPTQGPPAQKCGGEPADIGNIIADQVCDVYTPRALRFDPDAGAAGIFYDAPHHGATPNVAPPVDIGNKRDASVDATPLRGGPYNGLGAEGRSSCAASGSVQQPSSSFGSPVSTAVQNGLLEGAGESLWQLVQDVERMSICV